MVRALTSGIRTDGLIPNESSNFYCVKTLSVTTIIVAIDFLKKNKFLETDMVGDGVLPVIGISKQKIIYASY